MFKRQIITAKKTGEWTSRSSPVCLPKFSTTLGLEQLLWGSNTHRLFGRSRRHEELICKPWNCKDCNYFCLMFSIPRPLFFLFVSSSKGTDFESRTQRLDLFPRTKDNEHGYKRWINDSSSSLGTHDGSFGRTVFTYIDG